MRATTSPRIAAAALAAAVVLAGCSGQDAEFDDGDSAATASAPESTADTAEADATPVAATWPDPENLVAEDVFTTLDSTEEKVKIGIEGIIVDGDTMELRLLFTPEENLEKVKLNEVLPYATRVHMDIKLIDRENLKEYHVIEAPGTLPTWYQTGGRNEADVEALAGEVVGFQSFYAAPEDDIDTIDVVLGVGLPVFEDVPLTFED